MTKLTMHTINDLRKYYKLKTKSIPNLQNKIEYLINQLEGVQALTYSDMPTGSCSKVDYRKEKMIDDKIWAEKRLNESEAFVEYMEKALSKLNKTDRGLLVECYAKERHERQTEYMICKQLNISSSTLYRRKKEIIEEFTADLNGIEAM